ncbi:2-amino-4-hydroxy-6-hydroxymethyldihydropteridine diphosphokinase [Novosphingobium fuchskuhlense]|uniref:2-amino-4-hydroxy-6- hydroxymethyldihydropteridine diphosphokinase n=1 Tax=Novosphingobium fuchskuhlense TaxID=1117702 RepID=UPI001F0B5F73|nr:2-amino-4-hydroxy-6-hydroxymethyldihydropteridine diphosphokinase [Novosphingobium fuchskuhlense]
MPKISEPASGEGWGYLIALGSNQRHPRHGSPPQVLRAALAAMAGEGLVIAAMSPVIASAPVGPSRRRYANAAARIATPLDPPALLALLQSLETRFGRVRRGARWGARTLDLDVILWSGGPWSSKTLTIPHPRIRERPFVLGPAAAVAPGWRDPSDTCTIRHLHARLTRPRPIRRAKPHRLRVGP